MGRPLGSKNKNSLREERICKTCKKVFEVHPNDKDKYHSQECYWESLKGKAPKSAFKKGQIHLEESVRKSAKTRKRLGYKPPLREGDEHWNWKGGMPEKISAYNLLYMPEHPYAKGKYYREHRYICECYLGRFLEPEERPHHIDGNKKNNLPENLYLFPNESKHQRYEQLSKWKKIKPITKSNIC